jgi:threonine aldolase
MFLAVMVHCSQRGSEMICGELSHTFMFEQGGPAQVWYITNSEKGGHLMFHKTMLNLSRQCTQHRYVNPMNSFCSEIS